MQISVIGCGYLGATHAAGMAELGYDVLGVENDEDKLAAVQAGQVMFYEPGLPEMITKHVDAGRLRFTSDMQDAAEFADVHFLCVGTPQRADSIGADSGTSGRRSSRWPRC